MKYVIAISYFATFCVLLRLVSRIEARAFLYGLVMLFAIASFAALNDATGLIDEKRASFFAYDMHNGQRFILSFYFQYLLAWIPFTILDYEYTTHGMNIALQAFIFMLGAQHLFRLKASWKLLVFSILPSYYHYSIFGLRDPLINLLVMIVAIGALKLSRKSFVVLCIILSIVCIGIRPEFSIIILGFAALRMFVDATKRQQVILVGLSLVFLYGALLLMPIAFGLSSTGSATGNIELMVQFNEFRNERHVDSVGSGSNILGGRVFTYPFIVRYPLQVFVSFVAPLPTEVRGILGIIAFAESILFCLITFTAIKAARSNSTAKFLLLCGLIYMMLQALFVFNYGNLLRVRYPSFILFFAATMAKDVMLTKPGRRRKPLRNSTQ